MPGTSRDIDEIERLAALRDTAASSIYFFEEAWRSGDSFAEHVALWYTVRLDMGCEEAPDISGRSDLAGAETRYEMIAAIGAISGLVPFCEERNALREQLSPFPPRSDDEMSGYMVADSSFRTRWREWLLPHGRAGAEVDQGSVTEFVIAAGRLARALDRLVGIELLDRS